MDVLLAEAHLGGTHLSGRSHKAVDAWLGHKDGRTQRGATKNSREKGTHPRCAHRSGPWPKGWHASRSNTISRPRNRKEEGGRRVRFSKSWAQQRLSGGVGLTSLTSSLWQKKGGARVDGPDWRGSMVKVPAQRTGFPTCGKSSGNAYF